MREQAAAIDARPLMHLTNSSAWSQAQLKVKHLQLLKSAPTAFKIHVHKDLLVQPDRTYEYGTCTVVHPVPRYY